MGTIDRAGEALAWLGRQGPRAVAASIFVGLAVPALVIFRHRANIGRLLRGEEKALHPAGPAAHGHSVDSGPRVRHAVEGNSDSSLQSRRGEASSRPL